MIAPTWKKRIPNWLTISRVAIILPVSLLIYYGDSFLSYGVALALTVYAILTDFFDGYLSRKWHAMSDLGRLLDPIADKLLVAALLILMSAKGYGHPLAVTLIMFREIFISGLREFMQERHIIIHVTTLAKYKTTMQMLACIALLLAGMFPAQHSITLISNGLLWLAALLTVVTGCDYLYKSMKILS